VLEGLGSHPWNYEEAERRLHEWRWNILNANGFLEGQDPWPHSTDARPQVAVAAELGITVGHLIIAYGEPVRFFREIAPQYWPDDFDEWHLGNALLLGHTIWRWGVGVLLNDDVRHAFESATPDEFIEMIGHAEGRERYREGNPPGSGKGKPKKKRVDAVGLKARVAHRKIEIERIERLERGGTKRAIEEVAKTEKRTPAAIRKRITRNPNK
jgi:hypothetical protein